jgi:3-hydroxymyristoyl/3-hydroxydecanoyl-(acyl carrier protein) dehydratase
MAVDGHFRAFSFVDRIRLHEAGHCIRGEYTIPPGVKDFPTALVAEAVGQLAAWAAMSASDFKSRPVAGLAASIRLLSTVRPGEKLELAADLETVDADAVCYHGTAHLDGIPVIRLRDCVGPMMPVEEFDDPQALRDRFDLLCGRGATPGAFGGVPSLPLDRVGGEDGQSSCATFRVPEDAPFFADHFPRRAVLPGVLLMNLNLELAAALAATFAAPASGGRWVLREVSDVKLRAFTPPGETLEIEARLKELSADAAMVSVETRKGKRVVGGSRVRFISEGAV